MHIAQCVLGCSTLSILKRQERIHTGVKPFKSTMCGKSFSESGYLKRNLRGPTQERNHLSATNVTGASLSQITERIIIGALQVHTEL